MSLPILLYHKICVRGSAQRYRNLSVNPVKFRRQMEWLTRHRFQSLTFADLENPRRLVEVTKPVLITFDDGYQNLYENALPTLQRLKLKACVFVVAGLVGQTNEWRHADGSDGEEPLLTWDQMRQMMAAGIEFGSHAWSHTRLDQADQQTIQREMADSKRLLEDRLGGPVRAFAWPGGLGADLKRHQEMLRAAGYAFACRADGGMESLPPQNPLALRRLPLGEKHGMLSFRWKLRS